MNERPKDILQRKIDRDRRNGKMTRAKAIHYHCIDCMGYQSYEVKNAPIRIARYGNFVWEQKHRCGKAHEKNQRGKMMSKHESTGL